MKEYTLKNEYLKLNISELGAELCRIQSQKTMRNYLWNADSLFWGRHSPVLFPIVGKVWQGEYRNAGEVYHLSQHGFARDSVFKLVSKQANELWFALESSKSTLEKYPFAFTLKIGYRLSGKKIEVLWEVHNVGQEVLSFQIGAHPAFYYWSPESEGKTKAYLDFHTSSVLASEKISKDGFRVPGESYPLALEQGLAVIEEGTLYGNTWILENDQVKKVSLLNSDKEAYLQMEFDAPVLGIWSPGKANCPFICIEPWYGVCDSEKFDGELKQKDYINKVQINSVFKASYSIEFLKE